MIRPVKRIGNKFYNLLVSHIPNGHSAKLSRILFTGLGYGDQLANNFDYFVDEAVIVIS